MKLVHYHALTERLQQNLEARDDVLGLIALGSMSGTDRQPDEQSDHDFFVITQTGKQQSYRDSVDWIPYSEQIVLHFQETDHGCKVIYRDGHLLEYAIFDSEELNIARINSYQVLFDKATISEIMPTLQQVDRQPFDAQRTYDTMLANILVGALRAGRGELISGHAFIKNYALRAFLMLCWEQLAPDSPHKDNLDPLRRFEMQFPQIAHDLNKTMQLPIHQAGKGLLRLSELMLADTLSNPRNKTIHVIGQRITSMDDLFAR